MGIRGGATPRIALSAFVIGAWMLVGGAGLGTAAADPGDAAGTAHSAATDSHRAADTDRAGRAADTARPARTKPGMARIHDRNDRPRRGFAEAGSRGRDSEGSETSEDSGGDSGEPGNDASSGQVVESGVGDRTPTDTLDADSPEPEGDEAPETPSTGDTEATEEATEEVTEAATERPTEEVTGTAPPTSAPGEEGASASAGLSAAHPPSEPGETSGRASGDVPADAVPRDQVARDSSAEDGSRADTPETADAAQPATETGAAAPTVPLAQPESTDTRPGTDSPGPRVAAAPTAPPTAVAAVAAATRPSLVMTAIRAVGTLVLGLQTALMTLVVGPPVLPAGSAVTLGRSRLEIPSGDGVTVRADWYIPDIAGPPSGLIYFQHGFLATGPMYSYTAARLAERTNSIVVAPTLSSNFFRTDGNWMAGVPLQRGVADLFTGDREALTASALAAGYTGALPDTVVLVGHSLGGGFVSGVAGHLVDNGAVDHLAGVVLFDPVALNGEVPTATAKLTGGNDVPILAVTAPDYYWNQMGAASAALVQARPDRFNGFRLAAGTHIDAMQGGNPVVAFFEGLVTGFPKPQNAAAAQELAAGWVNDMLAGTENGIYGTPGEQMVIDTTAGEARAVGVPGPPTKITVFDRVMDAFLKLLVGSFAVYDPEAS